jgi:hypothetical protein
MRNTRIARVPDGTVAFESVHRLASPTVIVDGSSPLCVQMGRQGGRHGRCLIPAGAVSDRGRESTGMSTLSEAKAKLRALRQRLATEAPRAYTRPDTPAELRQRLQSALECVSGACFLDTNLGSPSTEEARDDALIEGHLALAEWERWLEQRHEHKPRRTPPPVDRRRHERYETGVLVKLLRYAVRESSGERMTLVAETASRPARNVSLGGILVAMARDELPQVGVGSIVHVSVSAALGGPLEFQIRAAVTRRDDVSVALSWIQDSDRARRAIESLLAAITRSRHQR